MRIRPQLDGEELKLTKSIMGYDVNLYIITAQMI